jgi:hypothetical protein
MDKIDYSEIMQEMSKIQRKREDALRNEDWRTAIELTINIWKIDSLLMAWLIEKILNK